MLLSRMFTIFSPVFLLFLLLLTACSDQPINLNKVITQEIATELVNQQGIEQSPQSDNLWLITDVIQQQEKLHGQIVSVVGYVGWQGEQYNEWFINLWNEPIGNYEDMWKHGKKKEYENETEKWNVCWTDCWEIGQDYATIRLPSSYPRFRAPELVAPELRSDNVYPQDRNTHYYGDPHPDLLFDGNLQEEPKTKLKSLDKYVLKVLVRDWDPGAGLTLVEVGDHTEMPPEQPPESINEGNPMSVNEFKEQYENFYGQTVSVQGWVDRFNDNPYLSISFQNELNGSNGITVLFPYDEEPYMWKMINQGLKRNEQFVIKVHVYRLENHTVPAIYGKESLKEYPFVILWVDGTVESE